MPVTVEVIVKNAATTTGEGPYWEEATKSLLYVDIVSGYVHRWNSETGEDQKLHLGKDVSLIVPCRTGGYIVTVGPKICHLDWNTKMVTSITQVDHGTKNRFNDGKCDANGRLWAGTMGHESNPAEPEMGMGSLYTLDKDRTVKKHIDKLNISNGIAWSYDNKIMYYIDSIPGNVFAFDFNLAKGTINVASRRTVLNFKECKTHSLGLPDGMTIDTEGKLWVACYSVGKVIRIDPESGAILREVSVPAKRTTSCCFGGKNYDELYVTCSKTGYTEEEFLRDDPLAGSVFRITGLGVKGKPDNVFIG